MQGSIKCALFFLFATPVFLPVNSQKAKQSQPVAKGSTPANGMQDRSYWCNTLYKIASPVVLNLAEGTLKKNMRRIRLHIQTRTSPRRNECTGDDVSRQNLSTLSNLLLKEKFLS